MKLFRKASAAAILLVVLCHSPALGQNTQQVPRVKAALGEAAQAQRDIAARLDQILKEQQIALSDGVLVAMLQNLIADERDTIKGIQDLGRRTLGKTTAELGPAEQADLVSLTQGQESCADRYVSFQRGAEHKALERPNSPFARVVLLAAEANLSERMAQSPRSIEGNQLALAMQEITEIVTVLEKMASFLKTALEAEEPAAGGGPQTITLPPLIGKGGKYQSAFFPWTGDIIDTLGVILRAVSLLEEQAKKQQEIAAQVKRLAEQEVASPQLGLATSEWEIRFCVVDIAERLGILDPVMESQIGLAVGNIELAIPHLEGGSITHAVEPTQLAADQLTAAAESLKKTWEDILDRLAKYTLEAEGIPASGPGVPHGVSDEFVEKIRQLVFALLRATGGMKIVMERQTQIHNSTLAAAEPASATMDPPALAAEQRTVLDLLASQVIPFNVLAPPYDSRHAPLKRRDFISHLLIEDASELLRLAAEDLDAGQPATAAPRQKRAMGFLKDAVDEMILALQHLLGQYSPPAMSLLDGTSRGLAIPANPAGSILAGWEWELPDRERAKVLQAFRGSFPERYAGLIQLYFKNIAAEEIEE